LPNGIWKNLSQFGLHSVLISPVETFEILFETFKIITLKK